MAPNAKSAPIETVFIGGGTPSILPAPLLTRLLHGLRQHYSIPEGVEFTSEANPGTLTEPWLEAALSGGVNRLSMGMQAAQPDLLRMLGRIHSQQDVADSVRLAREMGVRNLSLDLMFGLPGQTPEMWRASIDAALSLSPEHMSCYGLIPEDGTPLMRDLDAGRLTLPDEEAERQMYDDTLSILAAQGYHQYEISNFAKPGRECRHNIGYWTRVPYIGLGASAASFLQTASGGLRLSNPAAIREYIAMAQEKAWRRRERVSLLPEDARFESLMLGLRMTRGVSESANPALHGEALDHRYGAALRRLAADGLLEHANGCWRLTRRGMDVQNAVLVDLMDE